MANVQQRNIHKVSVSAAWTRMHCDKRVGSNPRIYERSLWLRSWISRQSNRGRQEQECQTSGPSSHPSVKQQGKDLEGEVLAPQRADERDDLLGILRRLKVVLRQNLVVAQASLPHSGLGLRSLYVLLVQVGCRTGSELA